MKNCFYLTLSFLFLVSAARGQVDCEKTMENIDEINQKQLDEIIGPDGESLGEVLSKNALLTRASMNLRSLRIRKQRRGNRFRLADEIAARQLFLGGGEVLALIRPECGDLEDQEKINNCREALLEEVQAENSEALERLEAEKQQTQELIREQNQNNKRLVGLSLIKKKLAQDYVRSCDTSALRDDELQKLQTIHCPHIFESGGTATLRTLVTDNMKIVQFLEITQNAISDEDLAQSCVELSREGIQVDGCSESLRSHREALARIEPGQTERESIEEEAPQIGTAPLDEPIKVTDLTDDGEGQVTYETAGERATATGGGPTVAQTRSQNTHSNNATTDQDPPRRSASTRSQAPSSSQASRDCPSGTTFVAGKCWEPCSEPWEYRRSSDARCMVDESRKEDIKKHRRKRTWSKIGKFAAITALAGGAIAAGAWAIDKLSGDNSYTPSSQESAANSGSLLPRTYRSSHLYPNAMPYGNMNYGQFYNYPYSFGDTSWIGQQQFERTSPYSIENYNPGIGGASSQGGNQPFSFGF